MKSTTVVKSVVGLTSGALRRAAALTAALTVSALAAGCVGQQHAGPARAPARAQGAVSNLEASVRVISDAPDSNLGQRYAAALRWAGVDVVPAVADADVVTELRVKLRTDANNRQMVDVSLDVRAGKEHLAAAKVEYPAHEQASKDDLGVLTSALTQSPTVRAYAERLEAAKQQQTKAADATAWEQANATHCAQSSVFADCVNVIHYLNGFPLGEHRQEAERALEQAELVRQRASRDAAIERVKADVSAWKLASPDACRSPEQPNACDGVSSYVAAHPTGRFAGEANELLVQSQAKLNELREKAALKSEMAQRRSKTAQR